MERARPTLSIIIATCNAAQTLRHCLDSLTRCELSCLEIIIKDGDSTDGTPMLAQDYMHLLPMRLIRRQDIGIYDAWNQALADVQGPRGQWVLFLGADDFISSPQHLNAALEYLREQPKNIDYASAPVTLVNCEGLAVDTLLPSRALGRDLPAGMPLPHQGLFHRLRLFTANRFDATLRITGDYDFLCRTLTAQNLTYLEIPPPVCMSLGGISGSLEGMAKRNNEALRVSRRYFSAITRRELWKRLILSYSFIGLAKTIGTGFAVSCVDRYRRLSGNTAIWQNGQALPQSLRLPNSKSVETKEPPVFSLLVATLNRKDELARLLESLTRQTVSQDAFEVLIADQNSPGFLQPVIDAFAPRLHLRAVSVPNKGVSQARNAILHLARGKFIAFPDDDCFYEPDTLQETRKYFDVFLHAHALVGSWTAPEQPYLIPKRRAKILSWLTTFKRGETYAQFYRREVVEHIGGFDPIIGPGTGLPYGCGEDTDYLLRTVKAGFNVMYAPQVRIRHPEEKAQPSLNAAKIRSYAMGRMYLLRKHHLPLWFQLINIAYPLVRIFTEGPRTMRYRLLMFSARLQSFFVVRKTAEKWKSRR